MEVTIDDLSLFVISIIRTGAALRFSIVWCGFREQKKRQANIENGRKIPLFSGS